MAVSYGTATEVSYKNVQIQQNLNASVTLTAATGVKDIIAHIGWFYKKYVAEANVPAGERNTINYLVGVRVNEMIVDYVEKEKTNSVNVKWSVIRDAVDLTTDKVIQVRDLINFSSYIVVFPDVMCRAQNGSVKGVHDFSLNVSDHRVTSIVGDKLNALKLSFGSSEVKMLAVAECMWKYINQVASGEKSLEAGSSCCIIV